jgi:hypothetical protein
MNVTVMPGEAKSSKAYWCYGEMPSAEERFEFDFDFEFELCLQYTLKGKIVQSSLMIW